jgi:hypothetical protein
MLNAVHLTFKWKQSLTNYLSSQMCHLQCSNEKWHATGDKKFAYEKLANIFLGYIYFYFWIGDIFNNFLNSLW